MKLTQPHIDQIKSKFSALNTKEDLVALINEVNLILYGKDYKRLSLKSLSYFSNPKLSKKRYTSFVVPKKTEGDRIIHAPVNGLKHILRPLNIILNTIAEPQILHFCWLAYAHIHLM